MFEAGVPASADPSLRDAGERAFAVLRSAADAICATMPAAGRPPALMVALHIWAIAHGVASLFGRADGAQRALPMSPAELLEAHVLVYLRGLGVNAGAVGVHLAFGPATVPRSRSQSPTTDLTTAPMSK